MNTILVPVDFSPASENAFQYAVRIANLFHARILLFHAYSVQVAEPYLIPASQQTLVEQQEELAKRFFAELEASIPPEISRNIQIETQVAIGPASEEVLRICEDLEPGLVVMGMKVSTELAKAIIGSTSARIVSRMPYPLLIVPEEAQYHGIQHIAFATNFEEEDEKAIDQLLDLAFLYDAVIHCVHVKQEGETEELNNHYQYLRDKYKGDLVLNHLEFENLGHEDIISGLNRYVDSHKVDMLAMRTHQRGFWNRIFSQSICKKMAFHTHVPLLVFQNEP